MKAVVKSLFGETEVIVFTSKYISNDNFAIQLMCDEGPYATLTVNLGEKCESNCSYVDTNNCPWAEDFIAEHKLGTKTGKYGYSGYCVYPEYEFNIEELSKYRG